MTLLWTPLLLPHLSGDPAQPDTSPSSEAVGSQKLYGDFLPDFEPGRYDLSWHSWKKFLSFLAQEQSSNSIELRKTSSMIGAACYLEWIVFVRVRYGTGGAKEASGMVR